jgi:hypothetical protein
MMTRTWDEAFRQLWTHAAQHRGMSLDTPSGWTDDATGCPRTRGSDVVAIAAVVDPVVLSLRTEPGGHGIARRWRHCVSDLADLALDRPACEYDLNRAFWATLAATLAHLASTNAPVPHKRWDALLAEIARLDERHAPNHEEYLQLDGDSYEAQWQMQKAVLSELRGVDVHEPLGEAGRPRMTLPRTTNRDVLQLATFWSLALIKASHKQPALGSDLVATLGLDGVRRRWNVILADVDAYARNGDPETVYAKNHAFWRATASVSVTLAAIDDFPLSLELVVTGSRAAELRNARTYEMSEATFEKTWIALHDQLVKARGHDLREPPVGSSDEPMKVPRTTNGDVVQLATYWNAAWTRLEDAWQRGDVLGRSVDPLGLVNERPRWQAAMADVDKIAKAGTPSDVYAKNPEFWRASLSLATTLGHFNQRPIASRLALDVPEESLPERILDFVKELPGQIADAAGAVAHAVGTIGREAGKGFFDGLGVPLLLGAGGVVALWLLLRSRDYQEDA